MQLHLEILHLPEEAKRRLRAAAEDHLLGLLRGDDPPTGRAFLLLRSAGSGAWEARLTMRLGGPSEAVHVRCDDPDEALAGAFESLEGILRRREAEEPPWAGRRHEIAALREVAGELDAHVEAADRVVFDHLLRPRLDLLRRHARRELLLRDLDGEVDQMLHAVGDLMDETMLRAWERHFDRPDDLHLDQWLLRILHEVVDEAIAEDRLGLRGPDGATEDEAKTRSERWWPLPDDDAIEALLGEGEGSPGAADDRYDTISPFERRTVALHLLDGYEAGELAGIFDADVEAISEAIERRSPASEG